MTTEEDKNKWMEFFEEFGGLLNKHGFMISEFVLGVPKDKRIKLISFKSDGSKVYPVYAAPKDVLEDIEK